MLCEHWALSPARVAMSWLAALGVDAAVIGPRSLAQLTELTEAPLMMTPEQLAELDATFPGGVRWDGPPSLMAPDSQHDRLGRGDADLGGC